MELLEYEKFAISLARKAGEIMLRHFSPDIAVELKSDCSPVTLADVAVNEMVVSEIKKAYPSHGILSEELPEVKGEGKLVWVCDPIDGTLPYSLGIPVSTFSLALVRDGEPVVAVVYDPFLDRMHNATEGKGAWLNKERRLQVSTRELRGSLVAVRKPDSAFDALREKYSVRNMMLYSYVYGAMLVASGKCTATTFTQKNAWDVAAAKLIIEEAGGQTSDLDGNQQRYDRSVNGFVGTNGVSHDELLHLINDSP